MYDITPELQIFYDDYIRLGQDQRDKLAGYRDCNIQRINDGLDDLARDSGRPRPHPYDNKNQGGYAMHTLNQACENDYDIDVALLFEKDDLPEDPLAARQRVRDALIKRASKFATEPEARTNAVTVWYEQGYHIDFAIYRRRMDWWDGEIIEHASKEWKRRDPMAFTNWFFKQVDKKSPVEGFLYQPKVANGQMRRIVRFLKWYFRSRTSWCLPGGIVVTTLVDENYRPNADRDDRALYDTMKAIRDRLNVSVVVYNPVDTSQELTGRADVKKQVERLRDQLSKTLPKLDVLFERSCTREQARTAWNAAFCHDFWAKEMVAKNTPAIFPNCVTIICGLARKTKGLVYKDYKSGGFVLPKGRALKFVVAGTNVAKPYSVHWKCVNEGDEAAEAEQLNWERTEETCWTSTKFKGNQKMICEIEKDGRTVARATHLVKIGREGWGNPDA